VHLLRFVCVALLLTVAGADAVAQALKVPRFVSLRSNTVNVRTGPGMQYPIVWVFVRDGMPVEVTAEFDTWRKIRDIDGAEGWVHQNLLSGTRTGIIQGEVRTLLRTPEINGVPVLQAEPGVMGRILACNIAWCRMEIDKRRGWLPREQIWGVYPGEAID
jgi:SH3-like domain-containing protein